MGTVWTEPEKYLTEIHQALGCHSAYMVEEIERLKDREDELGQQVTTLERDKSQLRAELAALRARVAELEAQAAPLALVEDDNGYKLYQCPFCGAVPEVYERDSDYAVGYDVVCHTKGCYLENGGDYWLKTAEEAVELWNNRAVNPQAATLRPHVYACDCVAREEEMRERAAMICEDWNLAPYTLDSNLGGDTIPIAKRLHLADAIRALPLQSEAAHDRA